MGQFQDTVQKWGQSVMVGLEVRQKRVAKRVFDYCIQYSPVLTGRYRASWRIGVGQLDMSSVPELPKSFIGSPMPATDAITAAEKALTTYKLGDSMYVTNNVPYADEIENGRASPQKAPRGVLSVAAEKTVLDMQQGNL